MMTCDGLRDILKNTVASVTFTKKDGTNRVMRCTLKEDLLPPEFLNGDEQMEKKTRKQSDDSLPVWDLDKKAWRSFRADSVTKFEIELR